eukprot:358103-Chlamydomonas_euryale.AAC.3
MHSDEGSRTPDAVQQTWHSAGAKYSLLVNHAPPPPQKTQRTQRTQRTCPHPFFCGRPHLDGGAAQEVRCEFLHCRWPRRREHERLAVAPHVRADVADVRLKAEVQHAVRLIQDKVGDLRTGTHFVRVRYRKFGVSKRQRQLWDRNGKEHTAPYTPRAMCAPCGFHCQIAEMLADYNPCAHVTQRWAMRANSEPCKATLGHPGQL